MKKVKVSERQIPLFDAIALDIGSDNLTERQIREQIIRKEAELEAGEKDYRRHRPSLKALEEAAATKNSNRAKVDGVWMDVRFCKYLVKFVRGWTQRKSNLMWEIEELKKLIA